MRDTAGETPALPFEKAASSFSSLRLSTFDFKTCDSSSSASLRSSTSSSSLASSVLKSCVSFRRKAAFAANLSSKNRRCEAASPYRDLNLEQDAPRTAWDRMRRSLVNSQQSLEKKEDATFSSYLITNHK
jgi:hypothetical protein